MAKYKIIADDFAMSKGTSQAIIHLADKKLLDGISVLTTSKLFAEYENELKKQKSNNIKIGLHLDFTFGTANYQSHKKEQSQIIDNNKIFNKSFAQIFFASFFKKKSLIRVLYREANAQLKNLSNQIGQIDYINGHQHIHFIPLIFQITKKLAKKYQIADIRIINEKFFTSLSFKQPPTPIAIIKFLILKFCYLLNHTKKDCYFYSILYSCNLNQDLINHGKNLNYKNIEIMIHPGYSEIDKSDTKNREYKHITSKFRNEETILIND